MIPLAKGAFFGLDLTHTRGDLFRAVLEGIADGHRACDGDLSRAGRVAPRQCRPWAAARRTRSGCRRRRTWARCRRWCASKTIGASYGDAFLAAVAVGLVSPGEHRRLEPGRDRDRDARGGAGLPKQYPLWKAFYLASRDIAHGLI